MSGDSLYRPWNVNPDAVEVSGRIQGTDTTGAVQTTVGTGFTAARSGTGVYVITLDKRYPELLAAVGNVEGADLIAFPAFNLALKTVTFTLKDLETPAATDLVTGDWLHFVIKLRNTSRSA